MRSCPAGPRQVGQVLAGVGVRPVGERLSLRRVAGVLVQAGQLEGGLTLPGVRTALNVERGMELLASGAGRPGHGHRPK